MVHNQLSTLQGMHKSQSNIAFMIATSAQMDVWCMVYDGWCMVHGAWCMVHGAWCMVYGVWCMDVCLPYAEMAAGLSWLQTCHQSSLYPREAQSGLPLDTATACKLSLRNCRAVSPKLCSDS